MKTWKLTSILTVLLLVAISVLGADPWISFGPPDDATARVGIGFTRYEGLKVAAPNVRNRGRAILQDPNLLSQTGGGMLVTTAEPAPSLVNRVLQLKYVPTNEDGRRFEVTLGKRTAYLDIFDWEAQPLVDFVAHGHHGAINASSGPTQSKITLDDAFQERLLGLRFIQADLLLRGGIASQKYLPRNREGIIFGNGEKQWLETDDNVQAAMKALVPLLRAIHTRYTLLTDAGEQFTFSIAGDQLTIEGNPYFMAWDPLDNKVVANENLTQQLRQSWPTLRRANPLVIRAVERAFRATAFFRYQQKRSPRNWRAFVQQVSTITVPVVPTPQFLLRNR